MPSEVIAIILIVLIIGGALFYLIKAKKSGRKCIGCPDGSCQSKEGQSLFEKYRKDHPKIEEKCSCGCCDKK